MTNFHPTPLLVFALAVALSALPVSLWAQNPTSLGAAGATDGTNGQLPGSPPPSESTADPRTKTTQLPGERPLASLLGMTLSEATASFGAPDQVFPVRGEKAWEDDVVFYYSDHSYLFWFRDRVWQVRVDRRFAGKAIGVSMGDSKSAVESVLGKPFHVGSDSEIFILPDRGFPVRARLFFTDGRLSDLYVYRGDF